MNTLKHYKTAFVDNKMSKQWVTDINVTYTNMKHKTYNMKININANTQNTQTQTAAKLATKKYDISLC